MCAKSSTFATIFILFKNGGTYEKDWNGIGFACMRCDGAGR